MTEKSQARLLLEQAKELLADALCEDRGMTVACHDLAEQIEDFLNSDENNI